MTALMNGEVLIVYILLDKNGEKIRTYDTHLYDTADTLYGCQLWDLIPRSMLVRSRHAPLKQQCCLHSYESRAHKNALKNLNLVLPYR